MAKAKSFSEIEQENFEFGITNIIESGFNAKNKMMKMMKFITSQIMIFGNIKQT